MTFHRQREIGEAFCIDLNEVLNSSFASDFLKSNAKMFKRLIEGFLDQIVDLGWIAILRL